MLQVNIFFTLAMQYEYTHKNNCFHLNRNFKVTLGIGIYQNIEPLVGLQIYFAEIVKLKYLYHLTLCTCISQVKALCTFRVHLCSL